MRKKYLLLFPLLIALSSCGGYSLDYIVEGDKYISSNFLKNYYEHWDDELANAARLVSYNVDDSRITSFKQIGNLDPNYATANPDSLNESKLGFNSTITEYVGEFDIVLNSFAYNLYKKTNKDK